MNNTPYMLASLFTLLLISGISINAQQTQPDLSMRSALYFTGAKADKIDLGKDKYVAKDGTMELKKSQATSCDDSGCTFNIGFIATRSAYTRGELSTYGLFEVESVGLVGNTVFFPFSEKIKQGIHPVKLKMGMNKVTFTIDPYKKTAETDESNNTFSANFKVVPDGVLLNKKGIFPKN
ncbi:MAG: hypothetical protein WKF34_05910 [Pyrinomonadaceae bacterium]